MSTPYLSVIVPIYNVESYLAQCLDSILAQTFTDFELLLIDDGSTDNSPAICERYAAQDKRIRLFHQENGGHTAARQTGLRKALGSYVAFVDSDDWIAPSMYQKMCDAAKNADADMVCCNYTAVTPEKKIERRDFCKPGSYSKQQLEEQIYPQMLFSGSFFHYGISPSLCNKLFRRTLLEKHFYNVPLSIKLGEDALVSYICLLDSDTVFFLEECFYSYRSNSSSITHHVDSKRLSENHMLFDTFDRIMPHPCMERQLLYYYAYQSLLILPSVFRAEQESGNPFRDDFLAECSYPPIRRAFRAVRLKDITGFHNKAYAFCIRHGLYRLFRLFLRH